MNHELCIPTKIEAAKLAITKPCLKKSVRLNVSGHDIVFGLPNTNLIQGRTLTTGKGEIDIPSTPYIFKADRLMLITERNNIYHQIYLLDQVILIGHGIRDRDDPRTWFFEDNQDVVQLASDYNSLGNEFPPVQMIVSCRRVLPMKNSKGKTFRSTRPPLGWQNLPGVIFQKNGNPAFKAVVKKGKIFARVTNNESDFIKVTKNRKIKNIRKSGI